MNRERFEALKDAGIIHGQAADELEQALDAVYGTNTPAPETPSTPEGENPVGSTGGNAPTETLEGGNTDTAVSTATPTEVPAASATPETNGVETSTGSETVALQEQIRRLEASLNVLQGKYNAETPRLARENQRLQGEIDRLNEALAQARTAPEAATTQDTDELDPKALGLTDEEFEVTGPEAIRAAKKIADGAVARLRAEMQSDRAKSQQSEAKRAEDAFYSALESSPLNVYTQDQDPEFNAFLDTPEELSGLTPRQIRAAAQERLDSAGVLKVHQAFVKRKQPTPANTNTNAALAAQVMPGKTGPAHSAPDAKPRFKTSEFEARTNRALQRGELNSPAHQQFKKNYILALKEGRVDDDLTAADDPMRMPRQTADVGG